MVQNIVKSSELSFKDALMQVRNNKPRQLSEINPLIQNRRNEITSHSVNHPVS